MSKSGFISAVNVYFTLGSLNLDLTLAYLGLGLGAIGGSPLVIKGLESVFKVKWSLKYLYIGCRFSLKPGFSSEIVLRRYTYSSEIILRR